MSKNGVGNDAAAKSRPLCLIPCNPMDCSPPGSSVHGISQARVLEWVAIAFSSWLCMLLLSRFGCVRLCATP